MGSASTRKESAMLGTHGLCMTRWGGASEAGPVCVLSFSTDDIAGMRHQSRVKVAGTTCPGNQAVALGMRPPEMPPPPVPPVCCKDH